MYASIVWRNTSQYQCNRDGVSSKCHLPKAFVYLHGKRTRVIVFFSSRRRHTRYWRDWSSDVCSSDLSAQFDAMLGAIRGVGGRVRQEKITGLDVTEEYVDLEARVRSQKALEAQIIEIMKRANNVPDALHVQSQLAAVRTEIERLEGRRRYLENQSSLSTIEVTLQPPSPFVESSRTGFLAEVRDAFGDGFDFGTGLLLGLIRLAIVLVPV